MGWETVKLFNAFLEPKSTWFFFCSALQTSSHRRCCLAFLAQIKSIIGKYNFPTEQNPEKFLISSAFEFNGGDNFSRSKSTWQNKKVPNAKGFTFRIGYMFFQPCDQLKKVKKVLRGTSKICYEYRLPYGSQNEKLLIHMDHFKPHKIQRILPSFEQGPVGPRGYDWLSILDIGEWNTRKTYMGIMECQPKAFVSGAIWLKFNVFLFSKKKFTFR